MMMMDVVAVTLVADPSTSLISGFTVLYLVTVAAAGILLASQQLAILVAAVATVATLSIRFFSNTKAAQTRGTPLRRGARCGCLLVWLGKAAAAY